MTTFELPAPDAPASEWGALAERIPGWRGPWTCSHTEVCPPMPGYLWLEGAWCYADDISPGSWWSRIPAIPDPDHWAWEGWLLRLLFADDRPVSVTRMSPIAVTVWRHGLGSHTAPTLGRACIAAAAALGRWPGGEG